MQFFSPAKVNLFMRVLGKRADGYHEVATLMQAVSLGDVIQFEFSDENQIICEDETLPKDERNLIFKAAKLFSDKTGYAFHLKVTIKKTIPIEAGLGGGSSNAATTLWVLNQLFNQPASLSDLLNWSAEIGSDITFFLSHGIAYCTGRGEKIESLNPLPEIPQDPFWIIKPHRGLSTPLIFKHLKLDCCSATDPNQLRKEFYDGKFNCHNDLELPAFENLPQLGLIRKLLIENGYHTMAMTGSGSAFYCFGKHYPSFISNAHIFSARFVYRRPNEWYTQMS